MSKNPLVSIITPVYNSEAFLKQTIESVLIQTYTNWELILIDDCSESKYQQQFEAYVNLKNIKIHFNEINLGRAAIRKKLASLSQKDYLLFLDCDVQIIEDDFYG